MISGILEDKGTEVWSVAPDDTVLDALTTMAEHNVGAVLVLDGGEPAGIVSERDYVRRVAFNEQVSEDTPVSEIMTTNLYTVTPTERVADCVETMTEQRVRHLPVIDDDGGLVGLVSIGDIVKAMIAQQEDLITQLERYIAS
jgi:CBS domain-containing protein